MVNSRGRRFVNEAMNYHDVTRAMMTFDPGSFDYANLPCLLVFDARYRASYAIGSVTPSSKTPSWFNESPDLASLAARVGVDAHGLVQQVSEFNQWAARGRDPVFHRGESDFDRAQGDASQPHPNLRPLDTPPYFAVELKIGALGSKGGPVTDGCGRVLDTRGKAIPGLFAAGNVAASVFGPGYPGGGVTLGAGMIFGMLAGETLCCSMGSRFRGL
jgi:hypothetical protein